MQGHLEMPLKIKAENKVKSKGSNFLSGLKVLHLKMQLG